MKKLASLFLFSLLLAAVSGCQAQAENEISELCPDKAQMKSGTVEGVLQSFEYTDGYYMATIVMDNGEYVWLYYEEEEEDQFFKQEGDRISVDYERVQRDCSGLPMVKRVRILAKSRTPSTFSNSIGMEFVLIPAGDFMMGSDDPFSDMPAQDEKPVHQVIISQPFYLGKYEVTQEQWVAVMGSESNSSAFKGRTNPVEVVSWDEVQVFIEKLNQKEGKGKYRLPTEAEWEYAARAGTQTLYFWGDDPQSMDAYAWYQDNTMERWVNRNTGREEWRGGNTHPVGQKQPNPWGLYDIYGNVWEWVEDWYGSYQAGAVTDPVGPASGDPVMNRFGEVGSYRVRRGGSWDDSAGLCRSAFRDNNTPDFGWFNLGFRLAFSPGQ